MRYDTVNPAPKEKLRVRTERYELDNQRCVDCGRWVRFERGFWDSMHLAHIVSKGRRGPFTVENTRTKCLECHGREHNGDARLTAGSMDSVL